jgi:hypothetical protein
VASRNLDLVRSIFAACERGDFSSTEWAHPEIEFVIADGAEPGSWSGVTGMAKPGATGSPFEDARIEADQYGELDGERVLVLCDSRGRGKTSKLELGKIGTNVAALFHATPT